MPTDPNIDPNTDIERETTGEPYVEGNIETDTGVTPGGTSVEGLDEVGADTPDSLPGDPGDTADGVSVRGEAPDTAP